MFSPDEMDDDDDQGSLPSFFRPQPPPAAAATRAATTPAASSSSSRQSQTKAPRKKCAKPAPIADIPDELLDTLSTYDKKDRSAASAETRRVVLTSRVARSAEKISATDKTPVQVVDDSLMHDTVGSMTRNYRQYIEYKGSERVFSAAEGDDGHDHDTGVELQYDPAEDDPMASRHLIAPSRRVPDQANSRRVQTFSEYTGPTPATSQFQKNLRHVKGPEQGVWMEVRDGPEIYQTVTETLAAPLANQEIQRIAVERGLQIPDLPLVRNDALLQCAGPSQC